MSPSMVYTILQLTHKFKENWEMWYLGSVFSTKMSRNNCYWGVKQLIKFHMVWFIFGRLSRFGGFFSHNLKKLFSKELLNQVRGRTLSDKSTRHWNCQKVVTKINIRKSHKNAKKTGKCKIQVQYFWQKSLEFFFTRKDFV